MGSERNDNEFEVRREASGVALSACLMVKNEEATLPRCLSSIRNHVDEIVVVDTGSTDRTVEIAGQYGARIYHHPWENDFSKHRNQSLSYAEGRWILIIDADEVCVVPPQRTFRDEISEADRLGFDALVMRVKNTMSGGRETVCNDSIRLFRNNGAIRYEGIVHNNLKGFTRAGASLGHIVHDGYDKGAGMAQEKFERTAALLKKQIADDHANAAAHMYLSSSYASLERYEESLQEGEIAVDLVESQNLTNKLYARGYYDVTRALILMKRYDDAEGYCMRAQARFGDQIDIMAALTNIAFEKGQWDRVLEYGSKYLQELDCYLHFKGNPEMIHIASYGDGWKIRAWMGTANLRNGSADAAEACYRRAAECSPGGAAVFRHAGLALITAGEVDRSLPYLEEAHRLAEGRADSKILEALFKAGVLKNNRLLTRRAITQILGMPDLPVRWLGELADFAKRCGDTESAMALLSRISEMDEQNVEARLDLSLQLLSRGMIEDMVGLCDQVLRILGLPRTMTLTALQDLSELFAGIGRDLRDHSRFDAAALAEGIAARLSPAPGRGVPS